MKQAIFITLTVLSFATGVIAKTPLLEKGAEWKYNDNGESPGEKWNASGFDDSAWKSGKAPLGYGDENIATVLSFGEDEKAKNPATFLRSEFTLPQGAEFAELRAELLCDDGAALYLNGKTIGRYNLGSDPVTHKTLARQSVSGAQEQVYASFKIDAAALLPGKNIIAISVHQSSSESSDLAFDLQITGLTKEDLPKPGKLGEAARPAVNAYHDNHYVGPDMTIPDGYVDGGTYMKIKEDGSIVATREVITVDRARDEKLRQHIDFAKTIADLPPVERASKLAKYIDDLTTPPQGRQFAEAATRKLQDFRNAEILLGEIPAYCGGGVCRHRSLLFKILGDEAGLDVGLRRGQMMVKGRIAGRHAWNELTLSDGTVLIVDVMNPEPDFKLPTATEAHFKYGGIKGEPLYKKDEKKKGDAPIPLPAKEDEKKKAA
jgi:hypothetical protein